MVMTILKPSEKRPLPIPLWLNWKESHIVPTEVYNGQLRKTEIINLIVVCGSQNLDLRSQVTYREKNIALETATMRAYKQFFSHYSISSEEVERTLTQAMERYPSDIPLTCTLNRYVYHNDKEFMEFCGVSDSILICKGDDPRLKDLHKSEMNKFWAKKKMPYRFVEVLKQKVIV